MINRYELLQLLAEPNTNVTTAAATPNDLSPTMKTFYDTQLLENARADTYFNQFGKKVSIPKNGGNKIEFRKFDTFAKAMKPLTEGVTPDGEKVNMTKIEADVNQYGDYTTISDRLELEAVDPVIMSVTEEHGAQAGETLDTVTRNEVLSGTNVIYSGGVTSRDALKPANVLTPDDIHKAVTLLKKMHCPQVEGGGYIAIIHTSEAYDLTKSDEFVEWNKYTTPEKMYNGEIGKMYNCRIVETPDTKVWKTTSGAVYGTVVFGKDAYGIIDPSAESLEVIVKQRGSSGTADPLNQRSTVGWKATHAAKILYQNRLVRIESGSSYSSVDEEN
ncbi:MAG: N4-gp56 family major capsid protein [Bilifractor sp.]